jgi:uncharacterized membrane protein YbaN (DUF454 family)
MPYSNIPTWKRILFITVGILSVLIGIAGLFIPVFPTTPFLLLATACFVRTSNRFNNWLVNHRIFGKYFRKYRKKDDIT